MTMPPQVREAGESEGGQRKGERRDEGRRTEARVGFDCLRAKLIDTLW